MRWPSGDQPAAGGNVRAMTGPGSAPPIPRVPARGTFGPAGRHRAGQRDDPTPLDLADAAFTAHAGPIPQPVETLGVEPDKPFPHRLHVTPELGGDGAGACPIPTRHDHSRPHDPVAGGMPGPGKLPDLAFLLGIGGRR